MNTTNKYKVGDHAIYVNNNKEQIITIDSIESNLKYKYYYGLEGFTKVTYKKNNYEIYLPMKNIY